jgi:hypothetical protein
MKRVAFACRALRRDVRMREMRVVAAAVAIGVAAAREDLNDAADGVGAIQGRAWATHDLDALDLVEGQMLECSIAGCGRPEFDPVE